ncbi:hypothetical protein GDO81_025988 [Engystomops pustulosus]|uniref:Ig-like domain-containing protein n=1 Tax=Engystomops pustulosus TaxID=76066 RepID=A0AAV6Z8M4_ENGPU|nr:hypothetical protein GDO81_025988 [Engystomops pustulosus]
MFWYKGITRISEDKCRRNILEDPESRTFRGTIEVKFPADPGCHEEDFRMELIHYGKTIERTFRMVVGVSEPSITEISCDPPCPRSGDEVTLFCEISVLYPEDFQMFWYKGITRISGDKCRRNILENPESRTFRGTIEVTFPADPGCHEEDFRMELIHYGKTIERTFRMVLGGSPVLSEITSDPRDPHYGQSVTLRCQVTGDCDPRDMAVKWLKGDKPLEKGEGAEKRITEKDGSVSCSLQITATALDHRGSYSCSVTHEGKTLRKKHYVHLPDKAPTLSAITVRPERPVSGKEAVFTVTISGFTPDIRVKWYKDFSTFPRDAITTSDPEIGQDFLFTCSTSLRFTPQDSDHEALLRCEVTHTASKKFHEQKYKLLLSGGTSTSAEEHRSLYTQDSGEG